MPVFIYLHGFASSPNSSKAKVFKSKFDSLNTPIEIPALDGGNFQNLTITRQLDIIFEVMGKYPGEQFAVIGSSMGGYLAALTANLRPQVKAIYLMAPGFNFLKRWKKKWETGDEMNSPSAKSLKVFHYGMNKYTDLDSLLFEDAEKWEKIHLDREIPTRLVHGIHDDTVPISESRTHADKIKSASLMELDSDHGLLSHIHWIVDDCIDFLSSNGFGKQLNTS